ncbi:MAG: lysine--tRNA ligase [Candidatus Moraniibacteriota bacterium]
MQKQNTFSQLVSDRRKKLQGLLESGINPYPSKSEWSHQINDGIKKFKELRKKNISLAGRLTAKRGHGGLVFCDLEDESGKIQLAIKKNILGNNFFDIFQKYFEIGDIAEVRGKLFLTRAGEKTLEVKKIKLLAKTLYPLPEKWFGLKNEEIKYRKRYLDLLMNPETKERFRKRSLFVKLLRDFLNEKGFLEVETPILQTVAGGALARPFKTRHNALGQDYYLRIAPELYLKRLLVGGYEKVFEFARNFRNEGISPQHNPDFTMLEFYWAYADYEKLMKFTEEIIRKVVPKITGSLKIKFEGKLFNFKPPYPKVDFAKLIKKEVGIDVNKTSRKELLAVIKKNKIKTGAKIASFSKAKLIDEIYKKLVRPKIKGPVFLIDYPKEMIPLAKTKDEDKNKIATFQLIVNGWEIVKAYNELNDPNEQKDRFMEQAKARKLGDQEAHALDKDYLEALNYGMPPTAGWGMGIDRLLVILLDQKNIRDVILFPLRRKKE